jgi:integrase
MVGTEVVSHGSVAALQDAVERAREYVAASTSPKTIREYTIGWRDFSRWCARHGLPPMPATPEIVALYIAELATKRKPATLALRLSAITFYHRAAGHDSPVHSLAVRKTLAGIRRTVGTAPVTKAPLSVADLRLIVTDHLRPGIRGTRDRAMLLLGFAGAFRRSELVAVNVEDIEHVAEGIVVTLRRSKTDQEGAGRKVGIPYGRSPETCPVRALDAWLSQAGIREGAIFRRIDMYGNVRAQAVGAKTVAVAVKHYAASIGRDASTFSGHSLRAGFATAAAGAGAHERDIMRQTGHRSLTMVRRYIRDGSLFTRNAAATVGL